MAKSREVSKSLQYGPRPLGSQMDDFHKESSRKMTTARQTTKSLESGRRLLGSHIDDFHRKSNLAAKVATIEYDPNRNARIALLHYKDGSKKYIVSPRSLKVGMELYSGANVPIEVGNAMPLEFIPLGSIIHNVELTLGKGGQLARAAGTYAQLIAKEGDFVTLKLPSNEVRLVSKKCYATLGQVGNIDSVNITLGKAGRSRWLGKKPKVRGVVKNPIDHPHGGGEGRSPIGRPKPVTPWGKPALGIKTRNQTKASSKYILRSRR